MFDSQEEKCAWAIFKLDKEPTQSVYVKSLVIRLICRVYNLFTFSPFLLWFLFAFLSVVVFGFVFLLWTLTNIFCVTLYLALTNTAA